MSDWTERDLPHLDDATVVVTGASSGIGLEASKVLAARGAHVVLACRSSDKARRTAEAVLGEAPEASVETLVVDLASLASVERAAGELRSRHDRLHVLVNNAGVMGVPYEETVDGFERQLATNFLGHFALTGRLMPLLVRTTGARVVTLTSRKYRKARIRFEDINWRASYDPKAAYAQTKLATLLFTQALQRRLRAAGTSVLAVAAHPGYAATGLQLVGPRERGQLLRLLAARLANRLFAQSARRGAWPILHAATAPLEGGELVGPAGRFALWGPPTVLGLERRGRDDVTAERLWRYAVEATKVAYEALDRRAAAVAG